MLKEIELDNFRSFSGAEVKFGEGVNLIIGGNAAGKTSVLDAISIALFGSGSEEYRIGLTFELEGKKYRIDRSTAEAELSGPLTLSGEKEVNQWIERSIVPREIFERIFYIRDPPRERWIEETTGAISEEWIRETAKLTGGSMKEIEPCVNKLFSGLTGDYGVRFSEGFKRLRIYKQGSEVSLQSIPPAKVEDLEMSIRLGLALCRMKREDAPLLIDWGLMEEERLNKLVEISHDILGRKPQMVVATLHEELGSAADRIIKTRIERRS